MKKVKEIIVSNHAVERFRQRCFSYYDWPEEKIRKKLITIARKGKVTKKCPGNAYEVVFEDMIIRTTLSNGQLIVITCLGPRAYRDWYRRVG